MLNPKDREETLMQFFELGDLPEPEKEIAAPFANLAKLIRETLPRNPERNIALRKLLESKDAAIRAKVFK